MTKATLVKQTRTAYKAAKADYQRAGRKASGTPKNSPARRDYEATKRTYHKIGTRLGHLTGIK